MAETANQLVFNTQYIKDFSFENPNAPRVFIEMTNNSPNLEISIDVAPSLLQERIYEVVLTLRANATVEGNPAFLAELAYAGVVTLDESVDDAGRDLLLMQEAPRYLFPFARAILAEATRDGGFPPLVISPIDFSELYRNRQSQGAAGGNGAEAKAEAEAEAEA